MSILYSRIRKFLRTIKLSKNTVQEILITSVYLLHSLILNDNGVYYMALKIFNKMSTEIKSNKDLNRFKNLLKDYLFVLCLCGIDELICRLVLQWLHLDVWISLCLVLIVLIVCSYFVLICVFCVVCFLIIFMFFISYNEL